MQSHDWNDLKYLLALYRSGKLKEAGRRVGTSETTVARRIKAFEQEIGTALFLRSATGRYEPTDAALKILRHAEAVETANIAMRESLGKIADQVTGSVRVSSVPIIVNRILLPNLAPLIQRYPRLTLELVPAADNLDLSKREADLALRFARPASGGLRTKAQKLGALTFGAYRAQSIAPDQTDSQGWITYDDSCSALPQAQWLEATTADPNERRACLRVVDADTALEAVASGLGKSLLPKVIAEADPRLRALPLNGDTALPVRDVWLVSHVDQTARASVIAAKDWLSALPWS